jgi:hypothetical protein
MIAKVRSILLLNALRHGLATLIIGRGLVMLTVLAHMQIGATLRTLITPTRRARKIQLIPAGVAS